MAATEPEDLQPYHDDEGGPTKTFLEHLEDLRWMLMKCVAVIAVTFLACLFAAPLLVKMLSWPLKRANIHADTSKNPTLSLYAGTNRLGILHVSTNEVQIFGTN